MIDIEKIAKDIAMCKSDLVTQWVLPIPTIEEMIALIKRQEHEIHEQVALNAAQIRVIDSMAEKPSHPHKDEEVLRLHRELAAEKLRADQGWARYESANADRNALRAEKAAAMQPVAAQPHAQAALSDDEIWSISRYQAPTIFNVVPSGEVFKFARAILAAVQQPDNERDAARMDWLEKRVVSVYQEPRHGVGFMFAASHTGYDRSGPNLRKLTDAAMAAQQGEKGGTA